MPRLVSYRGIILIRLQKSPYFCAFKYARAVKQKVWNEAENRARLGRDPKTLTPRFTDFFTDFEKKKTDCFAVQILIFRRASSSLRN